jgi:glutathione S-transferase
MSLTFYYSPMSSAARIHWVLEELGIPYEKVKIDIKTGAQKAPEYLKVNPNGKVPAIVDDGTPMFESLAILIHLGEKYGVAKGLWPAVGTKAHMHALTWATWGTVTLGSAVFRYVSNTADRFPADQRNAKQAEAAKKEMESCLVLLDAELAGKEYLGGSAFTLLDVANASLIGFARMMAGIDMAPYPNVDKWAQRCTTRPAMGRVMAG